MLQRRFLDTTFLVDQVVDVEPPLQILDRAEYLAAFDRQSRQLRRPDFAKVVRRTVLEILLQDADYPALGSKRHIDGLVACESDHRPPHVQRVVPGKIGRNHRRNR